MEHFRKHKFQPKNEFPSPRKDASYLSRLLSLWSLSILRTKPQFTTEHMYDVNRWLNCSFLQMKFERCWTKELLKSFDKDLSPKLVKAIWCCFGAAFTIVTFYLLIIEVFCVCQVVFLYYWFLRPDWTYMVFLLVSFMSHTFLIFNWRKIVLNIGMQMRVALKSLLMKKLLILDTNKATIDDLNNKAVKIVERLSIIDELLMCTPYIAVALVNLFGLTYFLCYFNNLHATPVLITSFAFCILIPLKGHLYSQMTYLCRKGDEVKSSTMSILKEFMQSWIQIKVFSLEEEFIEKLNLELKSFLTMLKKYLYYEVTLFVITSNLTIFLTSLYFASHRIIWVNPTFKSVLPAVAVIQLFVYPTSMKSAQSVMLLLEFFNTLHSLQEILLTVGRCKQGQCNARSYNDTSLRLSGVSFRNRRSPVLKNLNIGIDNGKSTCFSNLDDITKDNLLRLLLMEVEPFEGKIEIFGKLAFCSAKPWLLPRASLEENITFGSPFNRQRFQRVLVLCSISAEKYRYLLKSEARIGGFSDINISEDLASKISVARMMYKDLDIIIFDRPLELLCLQQSFQVFHNLSRDVDLHRKTLISFSNKRFVEEKSHRIYKIVDGEVKEVTHSESERNAESHFIMYAPESPEEDISEEGFDKNPYSLNPLICSSTASKKLFNFARSTNLFGKFIRKTVLKNNIKQFLIGVCIPLSGILMEITSALWMYCSIVGHSYIHWENGGLIILALLRIFFSVIFILSVRLTVNFLMNKLYDRLLTYLAEAPSSDLYQKSIIITFLQSGCHEFYTEFSSSIINVVQNFVGILGATSLVLICSPMSVVLILISNVLFFMYLWHCVLYLADLMILKEDREYYVKHFYFLMICFLMILLVFMICL